MLGVSRLIFNYSCRVHQYCGEHQIVEQQADTLIALSKEHDVFYRVASGQIMRGWALAVQGQWAEGLPQMHQGLTDWRARAQGNQTYFLARIAEAYGFAGKPKDGLRMIDEALALVAEQEERFCEAELDHLKGKLSGQLVGTSLIESESCFRQALKIARRQEAKSLELRAAISLSQIWQKQEKQHEARDLLASVYEWFSEGFDTADLKDAKALLAELASRE